MRIVSLFAVGGLVLGASDRVEVLSAALINGTADIAFVGCAFGMLLASNTKMRMASEKMALFDPLTNLPNRRMLVDRLLEAELRAIETGLPLDGLAI